MTAPVKIGGEFLQATTNTGFPNFYTTAGYFDTTITGGGAWSNASGVSPAVGDVMFLQFHVVTGQTVSGIPGTWTLEATGTAGSYSFFLYSHTVVAADLTGHFLSLTFGGGGLTGNWSMFVVCVRNLTLPPTLVGAVGTATSGTTATATAVTAAANDYLLTFLASASNPSSGGFSGVSPAQDATLASWSSGVQASWVYYRQVISSGSTGTTTATLTGASGPYFGLHLLFGLRSGGYPATPAPGDGFRFPYSWEQVRSAAKVVGR